METVENILETPAAQHGKLLKILGVGFGLAVGIGTPVYAVLITSLGAIFFTAVGSFELLLGISQFFVLVIMILAIVALFVLRRREPDTPRPYRTKLYPFAPALIFVFSVLLFFGYIVGNPYPSLYALGVLAISYPIFRLIKI